MAPACSRFGRDRFPTRIAVAAMFVLALLMPPALAAQDGLPTDDGTDVARPAPGTKENRLWLLWEQIEHRENSCPPSAPCDRTHAYLARKIAPPSQEELDRFIGMLDRQALARGEAAEDPEAPRICTEGDAELLMGFDPEAIGIADRRALLTDLQGVHVAAGSLKAPAGYDGDFGGTIQAAIAARFATAGLPLLTEEEMRQTPGQPKLNIYFSNTDAETGCTYSVFVSLAQTVLLTRAPRIKLAAGTWGMGGRRDPTVEGDDEAATILRVIDSFLEDYRLANLPEVRESLMGTGAPSEETAAADTPAD
ncbi:hypothetical protein [Oceanomicrobium pacificus]|uniref:Uncharacterized protein n=1 Tax=Oceanomicrobium pacificus TaxID=2692916 RepID=A0A6B0TYI0_9RHOB|nr:hypothetical protein [Oceanomicrobium pacificus]MXU66478.1 hypothetical protein [Oceanomicrobium pacificus]